MALEQPKKPVGGAFGFFLTEKRAEFLQASQGKAATVVSKMAGDAWKKLSAKDQEPYKKKYEAAKAKYETDMKAFLDAGGKKEKGPMALRAAKRKAKAGKKVKDPAAPKRPSAGGYGVFLAESRAEIVKGLPAGHKVKDVTIEGARQWKTLSPAAKAPYEAKFKERMAEYQAALAEYKKSCASAGAGDKEEVEKEEVDEPELKKRPARGT